MMVRLVIFDMDGTILDSDNLVLKIYQGLVKKYVPVHSLESINQHQLLAQSYKEVLLQLYGFIDSEHFAYIRQLHTKYSKEMLRLFPQVKETLTYLRKLGMRLGLVTSELREIAKQELEMMGIWTMFDSIITYDDILNPKPSGEGIQKIMDYQNTLSYETTYIGDQPSDALAAIDAKVESIYMSWNSVVSNESSELFDYQISQMEDLPRLINELNKLEIILQNRNFIHLLQFTDLHLMKRDTDEKTYQLIKDLFTRECPDHVVFTGDQSMCENAEDVYMKLGQQMDELKASYSFVFGNHDTEGNQEYEKLIHAIESSFYLRFQKGPSALGYGNYVIKVLKNNQVVQLLIFMDTHSDEFYRIDGKDVWGYSNLSSKQIDWYERIINRYKFVPSLVFIHIPPFEVSLISKQETIGFYEETPCVPPHTNHFLDKVVQLNSTKGIFFGHDHYNDFISVYKGITVAYGRISGHYEYGRTGFPKGARNIIFHTDGSLETSTITWKESK